MSYSNILYENVTEHKNKTFLFHLEHVCNILWKSNLQTLSTNLVLEQWYHVKCP